MKKEENEEMAYILTVPEYEATGVVKEIYEDIKSHFGIVPNVVKATSLWPELLEVQQKFFLTVMLHNTALPRDVKEMVAVVVSKINSCQYCVGAHLNFLKTAGVPNEKAEGILTDYRQAKLENKEIALLEFSEKITRHAYNITQNDINMLKELGWSEREILEAVVVAAGFNFINRVVDALGVEREW